MPIYEYKCPGCGLTKQERRLVEERDAEVPECKTCGTTFTRALGMPHTWGPTRGLR